MFLAKGIFRNCELDNYESSCQPDTGYSISWDVNFQGDTMEQLLEEIKDYHSVNDDSLLIEGGTIYVQSYEIKLYDRWVTPTEHHINAWRKGEQEIYMVDYCYKLFRGL